MEGGEHGLGGVGLLDLGGPGGDLEFDWFDLDLGLGGFGAEPAASFSFEDEFGLFVSFLFELLFSELLRGFFKYCELSCEFGVGEAHGGDGYVGEGDIIVLFIAHALLLYV